MPFFSIIIPVYKTELYLEKCLKSIKEQTFIDYECIVIDDGSPGVDASTFSKEDLLDAEATLDLNNINQREQSYGIFDFVTQKDERFTIIVKDNEGLGPTKNLGLEKATGKHLVILDSDDFLENDYLEKAHQALKFKPKNLIYFGNLKTFENGFYGDFKSSLRFLPKQNNLKSLLVFPTWSVTPICYFWQLDIIKKYDIKFRFKNKGEDTAFAIENILANHKEFGNLKFEMLDIYYIYRQFENQMTKSDGFEVDLFNHTTSFVKSKLKELGKLGLIYKVLGMLFVLRFSIYRDRYLSKNKTERFVLNILAKGLTVLSIIIAGASF